MNDMVGKVCIVTGGTAGIGLYTAQEIAKKGAEVIIVGRDEKKCISVVSRIKRNSGNQLVSYLLADLSSQAQVRAMAQKFLDSHDQLDVLVNNAGGFFLWRRRSADGIEMTFALNHLAYFLLTNLLLEALRASPSARVVNVSSGAHVNRQLNFEDLQLKRFYNPMEAYGKSKLANILFTYELARRLAGTHITANALTPGMVATDIWKKVNPVLTLILTPILQRIGKPPLEGAQTSIYLASSVEVEGISGQYFVNCHPVKSDPYTYDTIVAQRLWQISAELTGL